MRTWTRRIIGSRPYLYGVFAGIGMFVAVYLVDSGMARIRLRPEATFLDDFLLGGVTAALVTVLELQHRRELRRQQERITLIIEMNHHIRNALQSIVYVNSKMPECDAAIVREAARRIEWALTEVLQRQEQSQAATELVRKSASIRQH